MRDRNIQNTKVCKNCGGTFTIEKFSYNIDKRTSRKYYRSVCKDCTNNRRRLRYRNECINNYISDESMKIERKYKIIHPSRILSLDETGIDSSIPDEIFVKLLDYRSAWISNYGRVITKWGNHYSLRKLISRNNEEITCKLYRNVFSDKRWGFKEETVKICSLVVETFIINLDKVNNLFCYHLDGKLSNNNYLNLFPLNEKEYSCIIDKAKLGIKITEDTIINTMNDVKYRTIGWNPSRMKRTVCGVGYLGNTYVDVNSVSYKKWLNMMQRCYNTKSKVGKPYYDNVTVCEEWHNYSNFKLWFDENHVDGRRYDLDKDILIQGNMQYSPETCLLVSHYMNTIFVTRGIKFGTNKNLKSGLIDSWLSLLGNRIKVGSYSTEKEAEEGLFAAKKEYIIRFARKSKGKIPDKAYNAMIAWKVEKAVKMS